MEGLGFRVWGLRFKVTALEYRVWGLWVCGSAAPLSLVVAAANEYQDKKHTLLKHYNLRSRTARNIITYTIAGGSLFYV